MVKKTTIIGFILFAFVLVTGCEERFEVEVVGRVYDQRGRLITSGDGAFCYKAVGQSESDDEIRKQKKKPCQLISLSPQATGYGPASFVHPVSGRFPGEKELPRLAIWLERNGVEYSGSLIWQEGVHTQGDGIYRGTVLVEFYPD